MTNNYLRHECNTHNLLFSLTNDPYPFDKSEIKQYFYHLQNQKTKRDWAKRLIKKFSSDLKWNNFPSVNEFRKKYRNFIILQNLFFKSRRNYDSDEEYSRYESTESWEFFNEMFLSLYKVCIPFGKLVSGKFLYPVKYGGVSNDVFQVEVFPEFFLVNPTFIPARDLPH